MKKGNDRKDKPKMYSHQNRSRANRKAARRQKRHLCLLCLCIAAVALLCLPLLRSRPHPEDAADSLPVLQDTLENTDSPAIRLTVQSADGEETDAAGTQTDGDPWYLLLVNRTHPLPEGYQNDLELTELDNGQSVDSRIYPALQSMFDQMRADGVYPIVASGFRTTEKQQSLMDEKIASFEAEGCSAEEARKQAENWVAIPGTSEHQLGSAVDINADGIHSAGYQVYEWLDQHAHEYGFIHRYPDNKTDITGISNEPWHYRYVGTEAAAEIHRRGICLEEYLNAVP